MVYGHRPAVLEGGGAGWLPVHRVLPGEAPTGVRWWLLLLLRPAVGLTRIRRIACTPRPVDT